MATGTLERPTSKAERGGKGKKGKEKVPPLERKFRNLSKRIDSAMESVKRMALNVDRMVSHSQAMENITQEKRQAFINRAEILEQKNDGIKKRVLRELELLTRLKDRNAFADHNSPIIETRLKKIEKELTLLQKEWKVKSASRELMSLGPRTPDKQQIALYESIKEPVNSFLTLVETPPLSDEINAIRKKLTNVTDSSELSDILNSAEQLAENAKQYFSKREEIATIDDRLRDLAVSLNLSVTLQANKSEQLDTKLGLHSLKSLSEYQNNNANLEADLEEALKEFAFEISDELLDKQYESESAYFDSLLKLAKDFNKKFPKNESEQKQSHQEEIYSKLVSALLNYQEPEMIHEEYTSLDNLTESKVNEYVADHQLFLIDVKDILHSINIEYSSSGIPPRMIMRHYDEVLDHAELINGSDFSENDVHRLISEVDQMISDYAIYVHLEVINDESNRYTFESYTRVAIMAELQSILGTTNLDLIPAEIKNKIVDEISNDAKSCEAMVNNKQRHNCLKSLFDQIGEVQELLLAMPEEDQLAIRLHEQIGFSPSRENPPQLDRLMNDPEHIKDDVNLIIQWLKAEYATDSLSIETDLLRYVANVDALSKGEPIQKLLGGGKIITETIPTNKQAKLIPLQVRNINKAILSFIEGRETPPSTLPVKPNTTVEYADLGEQDKETGLYTGEIGKGSGPKAVDFSREFPKKDKLDQIRSLTIEGLSETTDNQAYNLIKTLFEEISEDVVNDVTTNLPSFTRDSERKSIQDFASSWLSSSRKELQEYIEEQRPNSIEISQWIQNEIAIIQFESLSREQKEVDFIISESISKISLYQSIVESYEKGDIQISLKGFRESDQEAVKPIIISIIKERLDNLTSLLEEAEDALPNNFSKEDINYFTNTLEEFTKDLKLENDKRLEQFERFEFSVETIQNATNTYIDEIDRIGLVNETSSPYKNKLQNLLLDLNNEDYADEETVREILSLSVFLFKGGEAMRQRKVDSDLPERPKKILKRDVFSSGWDALATLANQLKMNEVFKREFMMTSAKLKAEQNEESWRRGLFMKQWSQFESSLDQSSLSDNQQAMIRQLNEYFATQNDPNLTWDEANKRILIESLIRMTTNQSPTGELVFPGVKKEPEHWDEVKKFADTLNIDLKQFKPSGKRQKQRKNKRAERKAKSSSREQQQQTQQKRKQRKRSTKQKRRSARDAENESSE